MAGVSNLKLEKEVSGRTPTESFASSVLKSAMLRWNINFPNFHELAWVDNFVSKRIESYRKAVSEGLGSKFCRHNHIPNASGEYAKTAGGMFGKSALFSNHDDEDLKAIFELSDDIEPPPLFQKINLHCPTPGWKPISEAKAVLVLECLSEMSVAVEKPECLSRKKECIEKHTAEINKVRLPLCPAVGFLASLRVLFEQLKRDDMLNCDEKLVLSFKKDGPIRLTLPLKKLPQGKQPLADRWKEKVLAGSSQLAKDGGVCAALWDVSLGRVTMELTKKFIISSSKF